MVQAAASPPSPPPIMPTVLRWGVFMGIIFCSQSLRCAGFRTEVEAYRLTFGIAAIQEAVRQCWLSPALSSEHLASRQHLASFRIGVHDNQFAAIRKHDQAVTRSNPAILSKPGQRPLNRPGGHFHAPEFLFAFRVT